MLPKGCGTPRALHTRRGLDCWGRGCVSLGFLGRKWTNATFSGSSVCACVCARTRICVCLCMHVYVCMCVCVDACRRVTLRIFSRRFPKMLPSRAGE